MTLSIGIKSKHQLVKCLIVASEKNTLRFPRAWPQSPREQKLLSAGSSPHAIPVGVFVYFFPKLSFAFYYNFVYKQNQKMSKILIVGHENIEGFVIDYGVYIQCVV